MLFRSWVELGTATIGSAVTFSVAFSEVPIIITTPTGDNVIWADTPATTGFTPTQATGATGSDTTCNYIAFGVKGI